MTISTDIVRTPFISFHLILIFFSSETVLEGEDVLNTAVIGASLYNAQNNTLISPKSVLLTFRTENSRVNVTGKTQLKYRISKHLKGHDKKVESC